MVGVAAAFGMALAWSAFSLWLGPRVGLVDAPTQDPLKVHKRATPLLGGVGVFLGLHTGMLIEGVLEPGLLTATSIVLVLGLVDDRRALSPKLRLTVEVVAGISLVWIADIPLNSPVSMAFGVVLVVVAVNAVNLFDGLDGLVGSVTVVSAIGLAWAGIGGYGDSALGFTLSGAVAGFLILNWKPARVFLGDNGAYVIGTTLAYGALVGGGGDTGTMLLLILAVLGVFLIDLVTTITRRALNGTPILTGDRSHIYDRLRDRGWGVRAVALLAASAQAVFVLISIGLL